MRDRKRKITPPNLGKVKPTLTYAMAYPKTGRPYPGRNFKRMLGELADLGAFDPVHAEGNEEDGPTA